MGGRGHGRAHRDHEDDGIGKFKLTIPSFNGKTEPDDYLEWEMRVDQIFDSHRYTEEKKVRYASIEFTGYALIWWNQLCRAGGRPETWVQMKNLLRRRFVPEHFTRTLYNRLQRLCQGNSSVDEYYKEMEILMIRTAVNEPEEATMSRFFHGLNEDVQERIEMVTYQDLQELVHQAIRVEQQLKRRQNRSQTYTSSTWRSSAQREVDGSVAADFCSHNKMTTKEANASKVESSNTPATRISNIQCHTCKGRGHFKKDCPNLKKVLLTNDGYVTDDSSDKSESEKKDANYCTFETGAPLSSDGGDGVNLMVHKVAHDDAPIIEKGQRQNVFQSICKIKDKNCKVVIDGGSYNNIISSDLVHALGISTWRQPQPYYVKWLNGVGKLKITHRARVQFSVGSYVDKVVCDVVPMRACHLLLGRPWQFDHDATHHGRSNKYSFMHQGVNHVLEPMVDQVLKVEQFPQVKKPKKNTSKPRTVLFEGREDDVDQIMTKTFKSEVNASTNAEPLEHPKEDKGKTIILVGKLPVPILGEMTHQISSCNFPPKPN